MTLRVIAQSERPQRPYLATLEKVTVGDGFHGREWDGEHHFRWMEPQGRLEFAAAPAERFLELTVLSEFFDLSQVLEARIAGEATSFPLTKGWMQLSLPVPAGAAGAELGVNKPFPRAFYRGDPRTLAVRLQEPRLHADPERHAHVSRQHANAAANARELLAGGTRVSSTPPLLGIDMYGVCNVKPPCVYCEWDLAKDLEGDAVDAPFDLDTLGAYGDFFANAHNLVNCSIGEPFMMKNFDQLLEIFGRQGKVLEMTTNGQILTDRNIERLLGRSIDLYISLDAGTPETYAKLRNDTWDRILVNLRRLVAARKAAGGLPRIHLVFMPMRVNLHELDDFVRLCAELEVDRMVLRPLNFSEGSDLEWQRAGHTFNYGRELLPFDDLVAASARAAELCAELGVKLSDQMDFGGGAGFVEEFTRETAATATPEAIPEEPGEAPTADDARAADAAAPPPATSPTESPTAAVAAEPLPSLGEDRLPLCQEPWKSLYILRRGVLPCCYGAAPIAPMGNFEQAWNSPEIQHLRGSLAAGRFPKYCLDSSSCPIVRKSIHSHELPLRQAVFLKARSLWQRFDRATGERALFRPAKAAVRLGLAAVRSIRR